MLMQQGNLVYCIFSGVTEYIGYFFPNVYISISFLSVSFTRTFYFSLNTKQKLTIQKMNPTFIVPWEVYKLEFHSKNYIFFWRIIIWPDQLSCNHSQPKEGESGWPVSDGDTTQEHAVCVCVVCMCVLCVCFCLERENSFTAEAPGPICYIHRSEQQIEPKSESDIIHRMVL